MLAIGGVPFTVTRLDDDGAVKSELFLKAGVRVIPIGARLVHAESIGEGRAWRDSMKADAWHAIHIRGHDQSVPMNGSRGRKCVLDADRDFLAFAKAQLRPGKLPVHDRRHAR